MYLNKVICISCNGSGYLPQYKHIDNGTCFECGGSGLTEEYSNIQLSTPDPKQYYKQYKQQQKEERELEKKHQEILEKLEKEKHDLKSFIRMKQEAINKGKVNKLEYFDSLIIEIQANIQELEALQ
jgi:DnaJ-class molecular chaperone